MVRFTHEMVGPVRAKEILKNNTANFRRVDMQHAKALAAEMSAGKWADNGETVKITPDGIVGDGQHRLHGIVLSGATIPLSIAWDIENWGIDRGVPRTVAQQLTGLGFKNTGVLGAMARMAVVHDKGMWANVSWNRSDAVDSEIVDFVKQHHVALNDSIVFRRVRMLPQSVLSVILFLGSGKRGISKCQTAEWFKAGITEGTGLRETDAVLHLEKKLSNATFSARMSPYMTRMCVTKAWNMTVSGDSCSAAKLRLTFTGPTAQEPPAFVMTAND